MSKNKIKKARTLLATQGGNATLEKYGVGHYKKMAAKRWGKRK